MLLLYCLFNLIKLGKTLEMCVLLAGDALSFCEELFCAFREALEQAAVSGFALDEFDIVAGRLLAIDNKRILAFSLERRIEAEKLPVATLYGTLPSQAGSSSYHP